MLKILGVVAIVAAVVFVAALVGLTIGYSRQSSGHESKQQAVAEYKAEENGTEKEKSFWQKASTDPVAAFTLWLVIFTAVLSVVAILQLAALNRSEITSAIAANAAKKAADVSAETMVVGQRAWVFVKDFLPEDVRDPATNKLIGYNILVLWENTGSTPTSNLSLRAVTEITDGKPLSDTFAFNADPVEEIPTIINPHGTKLTSPIQFTIEQVEEILTKKYRVYVWGWAQYNDVFDNTLGHRTDYCVELLFQGDVKTGVGVRPTMCNRHNSFYDIPRIASAG